MAVIAGFTSLAAGAVVGLLLAILAIVSGTFGIILAFAPSRRGGVVSFVAIGLGILGILAALVKGVLWIF